MYTYTNYYKYEEKFENPTTHCAWQYRALFIENKNFVKLFV